MRVIPYSILGYSTLSLLKFEEPVGESYARLFIPYSDDCPYYLRLHKCGSVFMGAFRGELCSIFRHDYLPQI